MKAKNQSEHQASARTFSAPISTKHCIEISRFLRYKDTTAAKKILESVILLKQAVPFKRFNRDMGHKAGMAAGRFPQKAAKEFLRLVNSVEANAQVKGLNASGLKIVKLLANKAAIPMTGGRQRSATKRTNLEIVVAEGKKKEVTDKKGASSKSQEVKPESVKVKQSTKLTESKELPKESSSKESPTKETPKKEAVKVEESKQPKERSEPSKESKPSTDQTTQQEGIKND